MTTTALLASTAIHAGFITAVKGRVELDHKGQWQLATTGNTLHWNDSLKGETGSTVIFELPAEKISVSGPFSIVLQQPPPEQKAGVLLLAKGKLRALMTEALALKENPTHHWPVVRTENAVMGVRGTDFFASYETLLGETEVICFNDEVEFQSKKSDIKVRVRAGHWGGLGGRFGNTIQPPIQLSPQVLAYFKSQLPDPKNTQKQH